MGRTVSIGAQSFEKIRERNYFYVDKTDFIKEWWESGDDVTLITRPRRFGKTLNMNMLECFFSAKYAGRGDLFEGLNIWKDEKYREMQGTWPVIFLSFADIKGSTFKDTKEGIISILTELYRKHSYLLNSDVLTSQEKKSFYSFGQSVSEGEDIMTCLSKSAICLSIKTLANWMRDYYGKKVIILLDEYDTPMQEAYLNGYWEEITDFFKHLFNSTFKTNTYLERAIMTGITRVSKESIFSDLNNLNVVTATCSQYATAFGFTEEEVYNSLDEMGLSNEKKGVKFWYDGFTFGTVTDIYNPWSITSFLKAKKYNTYWANTSSNGLINSLVQQGRPEVKMAVEDLMEGKSLTCKIDEQVVFNQLYDTPEAIWSLFLASGYLKVVTPPSLSVEGLEEDFIYELALTNREVYLMFRSMINLWFRHGGAPYNYFVKAMLDLNLKEMNAYMNDVAMYTFNYFDTGKNPSKRSEPERFYHGFVLGLLVELKGRYVLTSNRESGYGRYDIMLEPLNKEDPAFVIEFKVLDSEEEADLKETIAAAHAQIEEKHYVASLEAKGIEPERIHRLGFAFQGQKVLIG